MSQTYYGRKKQKNPTNCRNQKLTQRRCIETYLQVKKLKAYERLAKQVSIPESILKQTNKPSGHKQKSKFRKQARSRKQQGKSPKTLGKH